MPSSNSPNNTDSATPKRPDDLFDCIRRFTDHHISSVLHSLIGLPTMLPPSNTWIMDEEDRPPVASPAAATTPPPTQEPKPLQSTRGRMAECYLLTDPRTPVFRPEEERLAQVWRPVSALHRDFAAPFWGGDVWGTGMGKGVFGRKEEAGETELDAYNQIVPRCAEDGKKERVVAAVATTRSVTGPDGVTRTKYMLKKRFADGSEERVEEERVDLSRVSEK